MTDSYNKPLISINKVATLIQCHHSTARTFLEGLDLECVELGERRLYRTRDVLARLREMIPNL